MQHLLDALEHHERRAVALVGLMIRMHGGKDGEGAFTGAGRYLVLAANLRLAAEQSRTVAQFWDRAARRLRWNLGPMAYDAYALALIEPSESDAATLRSLADRTQSVIMIARQLASRERAARRGEKADAHEAARAVVYEDPLDIFDLEWVEDPKADAPANAAAGTAED
jgi:hypothetical protein